MEYNKKIKDNKNLLLINKILKNTQENYPDNYYNNNNINNIICKYRAIKDDNLKKMLVKNEYKNI